MNKQKKYLVSSEEILILINSWKNAEKKEKDEIINQLIKRLTFLVCARIKHHKNSPFYDDLLQEGKLGILKAIQDFDPERGRNFFMFATWHIQTKIRRFLQKENQKREIPSGDIFGNETLYSDPEISFGIETREDQAIILKALSFLSDGDRNVIIMRFGFDGEGPKTFQQIGRVLGISKQRAQQIEVGALKRLRKNQELKNLFCS